MLGPHTDTPAPTARGGRIRTARPVGGQSGEGHRLDSDGPHNCGRHPPRGGPSATLTASNAGPQERTLWGRCWVSNPYQPHLGHKGRGTPAARSRGRAAGGGTAPDIRRPSQRWKAIPPGDGPPPTPQHAAPTGHAGQGDSVGPPHPHTRAHSTWVADPNSPPSGRAVGRGTAPDLRRHSQWWKAPPPGTPFRHPNREQRRPARAHAVGPVLGPHARTDRTRDTWVAEPWLPAPEDGRPGEGQRLTPDAPHNGGRKPPRGRPSASPTASNASPQGRSCGASAESPRPHRPHPRHMRRRALAARSRGRAAGGGTAPDTRRPSQRWQATPPGDSPPPPPRHAAPTGHAGQGDSVWPPHPHTRAHSTWVADPNSPPSGRTVGRGTAPALRRPSQWWKAPPPGTPFRHRHSDQRRPARAHAVGPVLGPNTRTDRTRDTRVAEPWLPAPEDGRPGEGQCLTPDAPHNGARPAPPGTVPHHPRGTQPPRGMQAKGTVLGLHTHTPAPQHIGGGPQQPAQWAGSRGRDSA